MNTSTLLDLLSHTALKGAGVLLVALLLGLGLRRMAAARRYALWITAIATLAVLPLAMWALPAWRVLPPADAALEWPVMEPPVVIGAAAPALPPEVQGPALPAAKAALPVPATAIAQPSFTWNMTWQDVVGALPAVWICIAILLLLRLAWSAWCLRRLERLLKSGRCDALAGIAQEIGLSRVPRLCVGDASAVPMVWGVWRPRLLLPAGFEQWSAAKLRGVLLHELAHLKRRDPLALWTAQWVKALHWFNPLVWLTLRQLRADQERACDDAVLRHGVRASDYAQTLLDLSRHNRLAPGLSLCALTITRCAPVEARVKAILDPKRRREGLTLRWLAGLAGGALLITLPLAMLHAIEGPALRGRILDRNGVVLAESTKEKVRVYPLKTLAAHMIGYLRAPEEKHAQFYGAHALEKQQNAELTAGKNVSLTLDMRIQSLAYRAMNEAGVTRGAAVVLDPRTGEILAAVSLPSYDPNLLVPSITQENWESYMSNRDIPLQNRCLRGFTPGASYLPLTALAVIAAGMGDRKFTCEGEVIYGNKSMQCWLHRQDGGKHGELGMSSGFVASCNCFWYQVGNAAGIEQIEAMGRKIGFGARYGISDDEDPGIVPSPSWLEKHRPNEKWSAGYTANTSIGSGMVLATPLQLAVLAATVGNSGKVPQPSLLKTAGATAWRADLAGEGLPVAQLESLRDAMRLVVNDAKGTGHAARSDRVVIAGRTGTAQNWRVMDGKRVDDNHVWFIGFAPFDKPTLAFAILKQGGKSGGSDCAPIAKRIVEETLALPADGSGEVKPVSDEIGRAHEKLLKAQAQFDASAGLIKTAVDSIKPDATTGFSLNGFAVHDGHLSLHGKASGMIQALQFREKLIQLELLKHLDWTFPVPSTMDDGKSVYFSWWGVTRLTESKDKTAEGASTPSQPASQQADAEIRMKPALANQWTALKKAGLLADLPAEAQPFDTGESEEKRRKSGLQFRFDIPRAAGHRWLLASVYRSKNVEESSLQWPDPPEAFHRTYAAAGQCMITIHSSDGKHLHIIVSQQKPSILIAPDYSPVPEVAPQTLRPPTPATDADITMDPQLASQWKLLRRKGFLADLPAEAVLPAKPGSPESAGGIFRFTAPREAAQRWLAESLGEALRKHYEKQQPWPEKPGTFDYTYEGLGDCMMHLATINADRVEVRVWRKQPKQLLIAPDESREPQPAGRLAPEHRGKGLSQGEAMPPLDAASQTLRPTISSQEVRLPTFRPQAAQLRLQAYGQHSIPIVLPALLDRLKSELSEESQKNLMRSYLQEQGRSFLSSRRMQQALVVRAPRGL
ncbi:MAG: penicillin-binding transpeptidase domain-containing protein [Prosthecobacter sp.]